MDLTTGTKNAFSTVYDELTSTLPGFVRGEKVAYESRTNLPTLPVQKFQQLLSFITQSNFTSSPSLKQSRHYEELLNFIRKFLHDGRGCSWLLSADQAYQILMQFSPAQQRLRAFETIQFNLAPMTLERARFLLLINPSHIDRLCWLRRLVPLIVDIYDKKSVDTLVFACCLTERDALQARAILGQKARQSKCIRQDDGFRLKVEKYGAAGHNKPTLRGFNRENLHHNANFIRPYIYTQATGGAAGGEQLDHDCTEMFSRTLRS